MTAFKSSPADTWRLFLLISLIGGTQVLVSRADDRQKPAPPDVLERRQCVGRMLKLGCASDSLIQVTRMWYGRAPSDCERGHEVCGALNKGFHPCSGLRACLWAVPIKVLPGCGRADYITVTYTCVKVNQIVDICSASGEDPDGMLKTERAGYIASPRYPHLLSSGALHCAVRIAVAGAGKGVRLYVRHLGRGDCRGTIEVTGPAGRDRKKVRLCPTTLPSSEEEIYRSSSAEFQVTYTQGARAAPAKAFLLYFIGDSDEPLESARFEGNDKETSTVTSLMTLKKGVAAQDRSSTGSGSATSRPSVSTVRTATGENPTAHGPEDSHVRSATLERPVNTGPQQGKPRYPSSGSSEASGRATSTSTWSHPSTNPTNMTTYTQTITARSKITIAKVMAIANLYTKATLMSKFYTTAAQASHRTARTTTTEVMPTSGLVSNNETFSETLQNENSFNSERTRNAEPWAAAVGGIIASIAGILLLILIGIMIWEKHKKKSARTRVYDEVAFGQHPQCIPTQSGQRRPKIAAPGNRVYENVQINGGFLPDIESRLRNCSPNGRSLSNGGVSAGTTTSFGDGAKGCRAKKTSARQKDRLGGDGHSQQLSHADDDEPDQSSLNRPIPAKRLSLSLTRSVYPPGADDVYYEVNDNLDAESIPAPPERNSSRQMTPASKQPQLKPPLKPKPKVGSLKKWLGKATSRQKRETTEPTSPDALIDVQMVDNDVYESEEVKRI